jgi:hypothetical protein
VANVGEGQGKDHASVWEYPNLHFGLAHREEEAAHARREVDD